AADQFSGGIKARDCFRFGIDHFAARSDPEPAESEGDATGNGERHERRLIDRVGPVALGDREPAGASPVLDRRVEGDRLIDGAIVSENLGARGLGINIIEFSHELLERVGPDACDLADSVFITEQVEQLAVEDLPCELSGLFEDRAAVARVGIVAKIRAFIDEAPAASVDHYSEGVTVLLKAVADCEVAEFGRIAVPSDGMASGPVAVRHRAGLERHPDSIAGVEAGATDLGEVPVGAEIARTPFGIGLEPAAGENDRARGYFRGTARGTNPRAVHAVVIGDQ